MFCILKLMWALTCNLLAETFITRAALKNFFLFFYSSAANFDLKCLVLNETCHFKAFFKSQKNSPILCKLTPDPARPHGWFSSVLFITCPPRSHKSTQNSLQTVQTWKAHFWMPHWAKTDSKLMQSNLKLCPSVIKITREQLTSHKLN